MVITRREFIHHSLNLAKLGLFALPFISGCARINTSQIFIPVPSSEPAPQYLQYLEARFHLSSLNHDLYDYLRANPEYLGQVQIAVDSRFTIGLKQFPEDLMSYKPRETEEVWPSVENKFTNELVGPRKVIGEKVKEIFFETLGSSFAKYTNRVGNVQNEEGGTWFNRTDEFRSFEMSLEYYPSNLDLLLTTLHEEGHSIDTIFLGQTISQLYTYCPPEILFGINAGKWQTLSQSFSIEGHFLTEKKGFDIGKLYYLLGTEFGKTYVELPHDQFDTLIGAPTMKSMLSSTAEEQGITSDQKLYFNKALCLQLGEKVCALIRKGEETFLDGTYSDSLTTILEEVYANMYKLSTIPIELLNEDPEALAEATQVQVNGTITEGCSRLLAVIRQNPITDIESIRKSLLVMFKRWGPELKPPSQDQPKSRLEAIVTLSVKSRKDFIKDGNFQELLRNVEDVSRRELFESYLKLCTAILKKFPHASDEHTDKWLSAEVFDDPRFHAWELDRITDALGNSKIDRLFSSIISQQDLSETDLQKIKDDTLILETFVESMTSRI